MGRGGNQHTRSIGLKPIRDKAEALFREGKFPAEVRRLLAPEFGSIPLSTLNGWRIKMNKRVSAQKEPLEKAPPSNLVLVAKDEQIPE